MVHRNTSLQRSFCQRISDAAELCLVRLLVSSLSRLALDADVAVPSGENRAIACEFQGMALWFTTKVHT